MHEGPNTVISDPNYYLGYVEIKGTEIQICSLWE